MSTTTTAPTGTDDYEAFRAQIIEAIWRDLDPLEAEIEDNEELPLDKLFPLLQDMGALGLLVPREYGGRGLTVSQYIPILAEFAKVQGGIRVLVHVHNSNLHGFTSAANKAQRDEVLTHATTGRTSVSFALTEPDYGTGMDLGSTAELRNGEWVINGRKWLITNADFASHFATFVKTADDEVSSLLVPRDAPGLRIEPLPETMGCRGGNHSLLTFEDARVPESALMGKRGDGIRNMEGTLETSRLFIATSALGTSERAFELAVRYSRERRTFGKPIGSRQAVQRYLAEMAVDIFALRNMIKDAAAKVDSGQRIPAEASMCKLFGLEAVGRVTDRALLVFGGIGYTRQYPIERLNRDARLNWLEEGTPTIQQLVIARQMLDGYQWDAL
jgi:alkylation response protein AidB-like acyl-CoA dehydrogenase